MSHVVASYVCRKSMFQNQTSWKGFSSFSTISLALSIVSVIPALLKPFIAISVCDYDYSGVNDEENSDEEEAAIVIETDQSKPVSYTAADQLKLLSYTDSSSEEVEDLYADVNFDEPIDLAIN